MLLGMAGDDELIGGTGNDTLDGGFGNDKYTFHTGDGADLIIDKDGQGEITVNGIKLSAARQIAPNTTFENLQGRTVSSSAALTTASGLPPMAAMEYGKLLKIQCRGHRRS